MLIRAFLAEALEPVEHEAARAMFEAAIEAWWAKK
jgi:Fe-S cluster assembly protein SufD